MTGEEERFQQAMNQGHSAAWDQLWDKAANHYQQALEVYPDNPKALTSLALARYELQEYVKALKLYMQAAKLTPNDPLPLEKVAELLERTGDLDRAVKIYLDVAEMYAKTRDPDKAIENWSRVVSLEPEHLLAHSRLALVYERLGRKQQAVVEYLAIASLLQHKGEVQNAIQAVNRALQVLPESNEARQAVSMLRSGRPLPKPHRPRGVTAPLTMAKVRLLEAPEEIEKESLQVDPIQEARQKALTILAGLLFEQEDEQQSEGSRHGLQSIVRGTGVFGQPKIDHTKMMLHLSQAIDLQSRGEDDQAINELERAMDVGLDDPAAYFDLGLLLASGDRLESAVRNLQRSVKHTSFALGARLLLGQTLQKMGRLKEASIEFLEALRLADAKSVPAEKYDELFQLYEPIIEAFNQHTDASAQENLCSNIKELLVRSDWRSHMVRARQQLPAQSKDAPPVPLAEMLTMASSSQVVESLTKVHQLARRGKVRTAMEEAFHAIQFAPTYLPLHICIGDLLIQEGNIQDAVTKYTIVAQSYSVRGEANRAINLLRRVIELSPLDMEARNRLIDLMIARGQTEAAILEYLNLAEVFYNLADLPNARKTYTSALRYAQQANIDRSIRVKVLHRMADIDLQSLDWRQALRVFEQIRTLEPDDSKARTMLLDINFKLGQPALAIAELDNYISHLLSSGKDTQALEFLETATEENPTQASIRRRLAELYRQMGRPQEAIEQLDIAGEILLDEGDRDGAIETVMAILALNPPNVTDYQTLLAELRKT